MGSTEWCDVCTWREHVSGYGHSAWAPAIPRDGVCPKRSYMNGYNSKYNKVEIAALLGIPAQALTGSWVREQYSHVSGPIGVVSDCYKAAVEAAVEARFPGSGVFVVGGNKAPNWEAFVD